MHPQKEQQLKIRVKQAVESALARQGYVSAIDVFLGLGWLPESSLKAWSTGMMPYLERGVQSNLPKITLAMKFFRNEAHSRGLSPSETVYLMKTSGPRQKLRFSASGESSIERAYRIHYVSPELSEKKRSNLVKKLNQPPEIVVFRIGKDSTCSQCQEELGKGRLLLMEQDRPLCMRCCGFGDFLCLPAGDPKLTRLAKRFSSRYAVVVEFSRTRKRYERQGLLVEKQVFNNAQETASIENH